MSEIDPIAAVQRYLETLDDADLDNVLKALLATSKDPELRCSVSERLRETALPAEPKRRGRSMLFKT